MDSVSCQFDSLEDTSVDDAHWLMYGERADWADVQPLPQDDGDFGPVVCIAYSQRFVDVYDRVRAVLASGEASRRVLRLLSAAIELNPANYTAWQARRDVLERLLPSGDSSRSRLPVCPTAVRLLEAELYFSRKMIESNPKNYQVWHHRSWTVEQLVALRSGTDLIDEKGAATMAEASGSSDPMSKTASSAGGEDPGPSLSGVDYAPCIGDRELRVSELALAADAKNFHAWQYRQWTLGRFSLWSRELQFVDRLLDVDALNNSAWNQRFRAVLAISGPAEGAGGPLPADIVADELQYCLRRLECECDNEAAWNYARGMAARAGTGLGGCLRLQQLGRGQLEEGGSRHALAFLVDSLVESDDATALEEACRIIKLLAEQYDPVRKRYWLYRLAKLQPQTD